LLSGAVRGRLRRFLSDLTAEPAEYRHAELQPVPTRPAFMPPDAAPEAAGPLAAGVNGAGHWSLESPSKIEITIPTPPVPTDDLPAAPSPKRRERVTTMPQVLPQQEASRSWLFPANEPKDIRQTARLPRSDDDASAPVER